MVETLQMALHQEVVIVEMILHLQRHNLLELQQQAVAVDP